MQLVAFCSLSSQSGQCQHVEKKSKLSFNSSESKEILTPHTSFCTLKQSLGDFLGFEQYYQYYWFETGSSSSCLLHHCYSLILSMFGQQIEDRSFVDPFSNSSPLDMHYIYPQRSEVADDPRRRPCRRFCDMGVVFCLIKTDLLSVQGPQRPLVLITLPGKKLTGQKDAWEATTSVTRGEERGLNEKKHQLKLLFRNHSTKSTVHQTLKHWSG